MKLENGSTREDQQISPYVRLGPHPSLGCSYWITVRGRCPDCNCERYDPAADAVESKR